MKKAAIYLRQSLDRYGDGLAVERQREDCERLCAAKGWEPYYYCDNDTSATTGVRKQYRKMLADIASGYIGAVVVWDLDRLHRQPIELEQFMALADQMKTELATVTGDVDLSTDNGRLFARIKGAVARAEVERKSARQKRAMLQRAQAGRGWGGRAFGYTREDKIERREANAVANAYKSVLHGESLGSIASAWNAKGFVTAKGGNKWSGQTVRRLLLNPRYAGILEYDGTRYQGGWKPIVEEDLWNNVRLMLEHPGPRGTNSRKRTGMLTGIAKCGLCNHPMGVATSGDQRTGKVRKMYSCKHDGCRGIHRSKERVDDYISEVVVERLSQPDAIELTRKPEFDVIDLRAEMDVLHERRRTIMDLIGGGLATEDDARDALDRLSKRLGELNNELIDADSTQVFEGLIGAEDVQQVWDSTPLDRQRAVIDRLMVVVINPAPRGKVFYHECIDIFWRRTQ